MRGADRSRCAGREQQANRTSGLDSWCTHRRVARGLRGPAAARLTGQPPSPFADPSTLLVYVMDIYDPWSYAYLPSVSAVLSAACPLVDVEVVQSGRYAAGTPSRLAARVASVAEGTGAQFGEPFLRSLRAGRLKVDATSAAAAMIALLATEALPVSKVLQAVQHEFFVNGRPLEDSGVLGEVSTTLGLDGPAVELFAATERARTLAGEDFELARDLDKSGGPLLLASRGEHIFEFDGLGASGEQLVDQFRTVLAKP